MPLVAEFWLLFYIILRHFEFIFITSVNFALDSRSNGGVLTTPLGFKGLTVGITHPLAPSLGTDSNFWIEGGKSIEPSDYAEVQQGQGSLLTFKGYESPTSAPYATTTLVPPINKYMGNRLLGVRISNISFKCKT